MERKIVHPLFFEPCTGCEYVVAEVDDMDEAFSEIKKFCDERDFHIHYTRFWIEDCPAEIGTDIVWRITFDVGSWSEFFHLYFDTLEQAERFRITMK